jgi:hypothetical protein
MKLEEKNNFSFLTVFKDNGQSDQNDQGETNLSKDIKKECCKDPSRALSKIDLKDILEEYK